MSTVVMLRGVPASGKTTAALELMNLSPGSYIRVNRDDIRMMLFGERHFTDAKANAKEKEVTFVEHEMIASAIKQGRGVLIDSTNLNKQFAKGIARLVGKHGANLDTVDFPVSLDEALRRDSLREKSVGADVIKKFFQRYNIDKVTGELPEMPTVPTLDKIEPVIRDNSLTNAIVVDIDGTVAEHVHRSPYDYTNVQSDEPITHVIDILRSLYHDGNEVIFLSGRKAVCRRDTIAWLNKHVPFWDGELFMRDVDNDDPDYVVKEQLFNKHINGKYQVNAVFDDRDQVCRLWHKKGLPLFRVGDPDASF